MKASSIFDALRVLVGARQPVFVWGGPGIGKSALIRQLAGELKVSELSGRVRKFVWAA